MRYLDLYNNNKKKQKRASRGAVPTGSKSSMGKRTEAKRGRLRDDFIPFPCASPSDARSTGGAVVKLLAFDLKQQQEERAYGKETISITTTFREINKIILIS